MPRKTSTCLIVVALLLCCSKGYPEAEQANYTPIVLWHGMGDTCCYSFSMGAIQKMLEKQLPGVFVYSIEVGSDLVEDELNGFFMNANHQIRYVHDKLQQIEQLKHGFNAIGFSQGGQFLRAYVERFNDPPIYTLVSMGGQHQGVFGFPRCPGANETICDEVRKLLNIGAYDKLVQEVLVQAEYWQDPFNEEEYLSKCVFLPDINNAVSINATYRANMLSLSNLVLVMFGNDTMVQPKESEWFGFYKPGQDKEVQLLEETSLYINDTIGIRKLKQQGKVTFLEVPGDHLQFTDAWFIENIIPFLSKQL